MLGSQLELCGMCIYIYIYIYIYYIYIYICKTIKLYLKGIAYDLIMINISTVVCVIMIFLRSNKT